MINFFVRLFVEIAGLFVMSLGIALSIHSGLGTTPISSLPAVLSFITFLSVGTTTFLLAVFQFLLQIVLLGRKFPPIQLLQLPLTLVFALLIDASMQLTAPLTQSSYLGQWVLVLLGIVLVGLGISIQVTSQSVILPGEGAVMAISMKTGYQFGNVKVVNDVVFVAAAVLLSLVFLGGFQGVREGTIVAALLVGQVAKVGIKSLEKFGEEWLGNEPKGA